MILVRQLLRVAVFSSLAFAVSGAQDSLPTLADVTPRGEVVTRLRSRANGKATYAVYLPKAYSSDRRWPIVFLLDPGGRALIPMELFRAAAEQVGYVLLSSYDSRSDGAREPNDMALDAMLDDAQRYLAIDTKRLYIAGFSGTARFAWDVSEQFPGALAGIIGFGAGTAGDRQWLAQHVRGAPFDYYGAVGNIDPNYVEMRQLERDLTEAAIPFRIEGFDGPHSWPPQAICARSLAWMELRAMRRGLRPVNTTWIDSVATARRAEFAPLVASPSASGWRLLRAWVQDFGPYHDTSDVASKASRFAADPAVRRTLQREVELEAKDLAWMRAYFGFLTDLKRADPAPGIGDGKRRAGIDEMVKMAKNPSDSLGAIAGKRAINRILVYATFYEFRDYLLSRQWDRAQTLLKIAEAASPGDGSVCFGLARVEAQLQKPREALDHLGCAERSGLLTHELMRHPLLVPLQEDSRFKAIDGRLSR